MTTIWKLHIIIVLFLYIMLTILKLQKPRYQSNFAKCVAKKYFSRIS